MDRRLIAMALDGIDEELIAQALEAPGGRRGRPPERGKKMEQNNKITSRALSRRIASLALAACLILALGAAAYALDLFGLRELYGNAIRGEMPEEAAALIERQDAAASGAGWSAQVLESYCDENNVLMTVRICAEEGYILAPGSEDANSPLWTIGLDGEGNLGDYAREKKTTLLFAEAVLDRESLGLDNEGLRFESASPREMTVYIEGTRPNGESDELDAVCRIVVVAWDAERGEQTGETERVELPVTLRSRPGELLGRYVPTNADAVPGLSLGELELTQTPLGISMRLSGTPTESYDERELMTLRVGGVEFHGDGSMGLAEDGRFFAHFGQGQGEVGDTLTLQFLDWDKETVATVTYKKS